MPQELPLKPVSSVSVIELDGELILFDQHNKNLFFLNSTAAVVWLGLTHGLELRVIADSIVESTNAERAQIESDIKTIILGWQDQQLVASSRRPANQSSAIATSKKSERHPDYKRYRTTRKHKKHCCVIQLLDVKFRITSNQKQALRLAEELFRDQIINADSSSKKLITFHLKAGKKIWQLRSNKKVIARVTQNKMGPILHGETLLQAYLHSNPFAAIHSAAVSWDEHCILLPGPSGAGKSTLTAALLGSGYEYCTDELALLTQPPIGLQPCRLNLGLKRGSWKLLKGRCPDLRKQRKWLRGDGIKIRYCPPSLLSSKIVESDKVIAAIVFPDYRQGASSRLTQLSPGQAIIQLTNAGYDLKNQITEEWIAELLTWLRRTPCYSLQYSELDEAVKLIDTLR